MPHNDLFIIQIIMILALVGVVLWIFRISRVTDIRKRYEKFCLEPLHNNEIPVLDKFMNVFNKVIKRFSKSLIKSAVFKDYSKKYQKYLVRGKNIKYEQIDYISIKFIWGIICIVIILMSDALRYEPITSFQISVSFLVGFFLPDLYWKFKEKSRKSEIERDMLKAIIIMNNSFKSGLSIMQAIYMVSTELEGPISEEFRKMYIDISFGLDMDIVFERFAKRVNTEEAHYITTSLSVLSKTGGNIVQVFASVERSAFTRKKLKEELNALAASANAIYKILLVVPFVLCLIIFLLNPSYFAPLITTTIGRIILIIISSIYVMYILVVKKIINVEE